MSTAAEDALSVPLRRRLRLVRGSRARGPVRLRLGLRLVLLEQLRILALHPVHLGLDTEEVTVVVNGHGIPVDELHQPVRAREPGLDQRRLHPRALHRLPEPLLALLARLTQRLL